MRGRDRHVRLYLLRHGEPARRDLFYGHFDVALSETGHAQSHAQATRLAERDLVAVASSDLTRAHLGAQRVASKHGIEVEVFEALREMHLGILENVPYADAMKRHPELAGRSYLDMLDYAFPGGGESVLDVASRAVPCVEAWVGAVARKHPDVPRPGVAVVAHNTVTRILLGVAAGLGPAGYGRFSQRYGAISRVDLPLRHTAGETDSADGSGSASSPLQPGDERSKGERRPQVDWSRAVIAYANRDPSWA